MPSPSSTAPRRSHWLPKLLVPVALAIVAAACTDVSDTDPEDLLAPAQASTSTTEGSGDARTTTTIPPTTTTTEPPADPVPGGDSAGDAFFPGLGNDDYDVEHYDITLNLTGDELRATAALTLRADIPLSEFNLDLVGMEVDRVLVDTREAMFERDGRELTVTPSFELSPTEPNIVEVEYRGTPEPIVDPSGPIALGWHTEEWGTFVASEPLGAATWFPSNDHPTDKATFRFEVTVPAGLVAAGPGVLSDRIDTEEASTFVWTMDDPMATYLASIVTGDFVISTSAGPSDITIRNVLPTPDAARLLPALSSTNEMLVLFSELFGPYPYDSYGVVAVPEPLTFALENQTLSLFDTHFLGARRLTVENVLAHELAHQWFGNNVSTATWDEIWLNEGFASWADHYWTELDGGLTFEQREERVRDLDLGPPTDVTPATMFDTTVYLRGALTLEALRRTIGDEQFFSILQTWGRRFRGSAASTEDFLLLVHERVGPGPVDVLEAWLFDERMPTLPPRLG